MYLNVVFPPLATALATSSVELGTDQMVKSAQAALAETQAAQVKAKQLAEEAAKALTAAQEAAGKTGVTAQAKHFGSRASDHAHLGKIWLGVTAALFVLTVVVALVVIDPAIVTALLGRTPPSPPGNGAGVSEALIRQLFARVLVLSLLLYAVVHSARNYRAHRHNAVLNQHRQTALQTFDAFVNGTGDDQTKNAVLLQATQAVFSTQPSGYLSSEAEPLPQTTIVEILRKLGPEKQ